MDELFVIPSIEAADRMDPGKQAIEALKASYERDLQIRLRWCHGDERAEREAYRKTHAEYLKACEPIIKAMTAIHATLPMTYIVIKKAPPSTTPPESR